MNLWKDLPPGDNPPDELNLVVEIPKGSDQKIELEKETGEFKLDRVLHEPFKFPYNYGLIPQTLYEDGDAADGFLISNDVAQTGNVIKIRPVGMVRFIDSGETDDKIIAVKIGDPDFENVRDISDFPEKVLKELEEFLSNYKRPEGKVTEVKGFENTAAAKEFILKSIELYKKKFGGK